MASNADKAALAVRGKNNGGGEVVSQNAYQQLKKAVEQNAEAFGRALAGQNVEGFQQAVMNAALANPEILSCDVRSIVGAALICASTGLQPGAQGYAYIVPYNTKENGSWVKKAQFQFGYKGLVKLAYKANNIALIKAVPVYERDEWYFCETSSGQEFRHAPAFVKDRGEVVLVYSLIRYKDGRSDVLPMLVEDINAIRDMSKGYKGRDGRVNQGSPWAKHWVAMAQKTAIKQHLKTAELGDDVARAIASDEKTVTWTPAKAAQVEAADADPAALKDETPWNEEEVEEAEVAVSTDESIEVDADTGEVLEGEVEDEEVPGMDAEQYRASLEKQAQAKMADMHQPTAGEQAGVSDNLDEYVERAQSQLDATLEEDVIPPATKLGYSNDQARDRQVKNLFMAAKTMSVPKETLREWVNEQGVKHTKQLTKQQVVALVKRVGQYAA